MRKLYLKPTTVVAVGHSNEGTTMTLPVGRIVWGHPGKPKPAKDNRGNPKMGKDGQQLMETSFGLAIPEADFNNTVWPAMHAEAAKEYPNGAPGKFSWKITQPTEIDPNGKPYAEREGYAGHVVLAISTVLEPPAAYRWDATRNMWAQMDASEIKTGDYVQVETNFKVNKPTDPTHTPSLYVNPRSVAFVGYGPEIVGSYQSDPNAAFGSGPPPMPAGASATPVAGAGSGGVGMPGSTPPVGNSGQPAGAQPMPGSTPMSAPAQPPAPAASPSSTQRPTDPSHIHDNGNGTEQWFVNGAWDGGQHPAPQAAPATLPPPATGFVADAAGAAPAQGATPPMPGAPPPR